MKYHTYRKCLCVSNIDAWLTNHVYVWSSLVSRMLEASSVSLHFKKLFSILTFNMYASCHVEHCHQNLFRKAMHTWKYWSECSFISQWFSFQVFPLHRPTSVWEYSSFVYCSGWHNLMEFTKVCFVSTPVHSEINQILFPHLYRKCFWSLDPMNSIFL